MKHASQNGFWMLDPAVTFLNHGSFGSCPRPVFEFQQTIRKRMERQPVQFFVRDLEGLWDSARVELARFVGADAGNLVFVPNATAGVNTVLRSLEFRAGDELLVTDHEYNACRNALDFVAERTGARVVVAQIPFPPREPGEIVETILDCATERTRLALVDHVTSQTALVFPIGRIVSELAQLGIDTLVDGAHAPGMVPVNVREIGAAYYTGNCHKWICAPKSAGFLCVRQDRQQYARPLSISHGANSPRRDRSRFLIEFGWTGTWDSSACLSVPAALRIMGSLLPGGWTELMQRNHQLVLAGRNILCEALKIEQPCADELIGSMASIPLSPAPVEQPPSSPLYSDPLQDRLRLEHSIEVPIIPWPPVANPESSQARVLRISAQLYNSLEQYSKLAEALKGIGVC